MRKRTQYRPINGRRQGRHYAERVVSDRRRRARHGFDGLMRCTNAPGQTSVDVIDISGGTYFPGAASSSDRVSTGPYLADFARRARTMTDSALVLTGGVNTRREAAELIANGVVDLVGLARTMVLDPELPTTWLGPGSTDPEFPTFESPPTAGSPPGARWA